MNIYIWHYVEKCSDSYHSGGGVVVTAESEEEARELANKTEGCKVKETEVPHYVYSCDANVKQVLIFPDAGCC